MEQGILGEFQKRQMERRIRDRRDPRISELIDCLPYSPRRVIELRYGLADGHRYSLEETAAVFAKSVDWVIGIESFALFQLHSLYHQPRGALSDLPGD